MPVKKKIFFAIVLAFTVLMIVLTIDMASKTSKPWDRKKNNILEKYKIDR